MLDEFVCGKEFSFFSQRKFSGFGKASRMENTTETSVCNEQHECARSCDNSIFSCSTAENSIKLTFRMFMERKSKRESERSVQCFRNHFVLRKIFRVRKYSFLPSQTD